MSTVITPDQFERCITRLTLKLQDIAGRAGVPEDECADLEATLAALPPFSRERASVLLQGVRAQTDDTCMAVAAGYVLNLAQDVWSAPFVSEPATAGRSPPHR